MELILPIPSVDLMPGERIDNLQFKGLRIIQNPRAFCFGMDAVLLSSFAEIRPGERSADLGTGTGILPILLSAKSRRVKFDAVEIQPDMAGMAARSVSLNNMADKITVHCGDLRDLSQGNLLPRFRYDVVVCNPPYGKDGDIPRRDERHRIARQTHGCTIDDVSEAALYLLRNSGRLYMIFPTPRILELTDSLKRHRLEPKRIRIIQPSENKAPNLFLIEAYKNARPGVQLMKPLIIYDKNGEYTEEVNRIYHKSEEGI